VLLPRQRSKLARGAKDEEHAMSQNLSGAIAVVGIDIGKNSFHIVGLMNAVQLRCVRSGRVAKLKRGSPISRRA
jgi:hypothetical protein